MTSSPCFDRETRQDCPRRHAGCAATCPDWAEYEKQRNARYEEIEQLHKNTNAYHSVRKKRTELFRKHQGRFPRQKYLGGKDNE